MDREARDYNICSLLDGNGFDSLQLANTEMSQHWTMGRETSILILRGCSRKKMTHTSDTTKKTIIGGLEQCIFVQSDGEPSPSAPHDSVQSKTTIVPSVLRRPDVSPKKNPDFQVRRSCWLTNTHHKHPRPALHEPYTVSTKGALAKSPAPQCSCSPIKPVLAKEDGRPACWQSPMI